MSRIDRRRFLGTTAAAVMLGGCDQLSENPKVSKVLFKGSDANRAVQRALTAKMALAPEYNPSDLSLHFKANGSTDPTETDYVALVKNGFADWRLEIGGLVERPVSLSLADIRALPSRTQITRHDCVEGWSCIGKWTGTPLGPILQQAGIKPEAQYVAFFCYDAVDSDSPDEKYYETIDFNDAFHPQTILAYEMNDETLGIPHGAPLRLRAERRLGYKMAKYIKRIELIADYKHIAGGRGGYWEDQGYDWYGGI